MRITAIVLAILLSIAANASEFPNFLGTKEATTVQQSAKPASLQFLAALDNPPFSFLDASSKLNGFSIYLARAVCEELSNTSNCIIAGRLNSDLDLTSGLDTESIVISNAAVSNAVLANYRFSRPFLRIPARFAGRKQAADQLDFTKNLPGLKIGVVANSAYERMLSSYFPEAKATGYASNSLLLKDVSDGKIDLAFAGGIELATWLGSDDGNGCCAFVDGAFYSSHFLGEGVRFAVPVASGNLVTQLDSALISLQRKGRIEELFLRFFPVSFF